MTTKATGILIESKLEFESICEQENQAGYVSRVLACLQRSNIQVNEVLNLLPPENSTRLMGEHTLQQKEAWL